jgi:signal transduction histidine kinase
MLGAPVGSIIPSSDRQRGEALFRKVIEDGEVATFEFQDRDAQGFPRTLATIISLVSDDEGTKLGAMACLRDITARIDLEVEVARRERLASLGQMAGALAHHFNNILGGAVTSVDFALSSDDPDLQAHSLEQTSEALARATKVIDSLLAFAEGDQRHQDRSDVTDVINQVVAYMEPELVSEDIKLERTLGAIPETQVPRAQLVTVLENIIHNAVDAMPDGGTVAIRTSCVDGEVSLSVTDTGCGADEATLEHIFEPFYSTKTSEMGFEHHPGLGLAVAHGILHVLGHKIEISSTVGGGTTVTIRFGSGSGETALG